MEKYEPKGFALKIFQDRYAIYPEETFQQACERIANHISNAELGNKREEYSHQFKDLLLTNRFSPGGRIWRGAGRPRGQLLNCFVIPAEDSREGWGQALSDVTIISGTGGGVGLNFSKIRPRGTPIRGTGGEATGSVSLMRAINAVCNELREGGGRRSALMFCLQYDHPDLMEFLEAKLDKKELNNANISVCIDNEFLRLLDNDEEIVFKWQGNETSRIKAKIIWDKIIENSLKSGDPGILNLGLANEMNSISYVTNLIASNPCFTQEMRLQTDSGLVSLRSLCDSENTNMVVTDNRCINTVLRGTKSRYASPVLKTGRQQQIYKMTTSNGHVIRCTEYHEFITPLGRRPLMALNPGHDLNLQSGEGRWGNIGDYEDGLILGSFTGDGTTFISKNKKVTMCLDYWNENGLCEQILHIINQKIRILSESMHRDYGNLSITTCAQKTKQRIASTRLTKYFQEKFGLDIKTLKTQLPESIWQGSRDMVRGYLAGFFQADGSVQLKERGTKGSLSIRLSQSNLSLLREVQILLGNFGIVSSISKRRDAQYTNLPDGHGGSKPYWCKSQYELIINRPNAIVFENSIGFAGKKQKELSEALDKRGRKCRKEERFITKVKSIEKDGIEDVYCLNEPETHSLIVNGLVTGNCGEIYLSAYDCCCLGSINLSTHIINGQIDWDILEETIALGIRFLDNVLDQNHYPLPIIEETCHKYRRIGLGVMGLHDMLLKLKLKYSTTKAKELINKVMDFIKKRAYDTSIEIAIEKGSFHALDREKHIKTGFVKKCLTPSIRRRIKQHGLRNCALLTIPPTGTTAIVAGTTSGIEPIFEKMYWRSFNVHRNMHSKDREKNRELVVHPLVEEYLKSNKSIKHFESAHDISPENHLAIQEVCQKHIDNSISKTINLPSNYSKKQLSEIMRKFVYTLKGMTIYRDTSKSNSPLITATEKEVKENLRNIVSEVLPKDCPSGACETS